MDRIRDKVQCNPTVKLTKGEMYPFVGIDRITSGNRDIAIANKEVYSGQSCSKFCKGDTIMARITPCLENGKIAQYNLDSEIAMGSTELFVFREMENISDKDYIYYLISTDYVRNNAVNSMTGASGRQRADIKFIGKLKWNFPEYDVQCKIGKILSTYDDLIEKNNRKIEILQDMAEELYKEWFVRFRFPGHETAKFTEGFPEGWQVKSLNDVCQITTGNKDANQATGEGMYPFFTCARETTLTTDEYILDTNAILVSGNGSYTGFVKKYSGKFDLYQRTYALYDFNDIDWLYLYWVMKTDFEPKHMGGTNGAAIPYITKPVLQRYKLLVPTVDLLDKAGKIFSYCHEQCNLLEKQNINLKQQRDLLLPRLMSGKLEVKVKQEV